jgi:hypothetical protein
MISQRNLTKTATTLKCRPLQSIKYSKNNNIFVRTRYIDLDDTYVCSCLMANGFHLTNQKCKGTYKYSKQFLH